MGPRMFMYLILIFIMAAVVEELVTNYLSSGLQAGAPQGMGDYGSLRALCGSAAADCRGLRASASNATCEFECAPCGLMDSYVGDANATGYNACLGAR